MRYVFLVLAILAELLAASAAELGELHWPPRLGALWRSFVCADGGAGECRRVLRDLNRRDCGVKPAAQH